MLLHSGEGISETYFEGWGLIFNGLLEDLHVFLHVVNVLLHPRHAALNLVLGIQHFSNTERKGIVRVVPGGPNLVGCLDEQIVNHGVDPLPCSSLRLSTTQERLRKSSPSLRNADGRVRFFNSRVELDLSGESGELGGTRVNLQCVLLPLQVPLKLKSCSPRHKPNRNELFPVEFQFLKNVQV